MKLRLSNVSMLPDLEMEMDGLAVITGVNCTGKSTILKSLYCALRPSHGFEAAKVEDSVLSLQSIIADSLGPGTFDRDEAPDRLLERARSIDPGRMSDDDIMRLDLAERLLGGELDDDFYGMMVEEAIGAEFGSLSQFVNPRGGGTATLELEGRSEKCRCEVTSDGVSWEGPTGRLPDVHYYDSPFVLDQRCASGPCPRDHREILYETIHMGSGQSTVQAMLDRSRRGAFDSLVNCVVGGGISADASSFITRDGTTVGIGNMAAGMRVFAVLRILADKGRLGRGCVLLLDEPEAHLHPTWINVLAETVATMVVDMGVRVVMTTHSPQLMMAVEGAVIDDGVPAKFYDLFHGQDGLEFSGPLDDEGIQRVYARMAGPIVEAGYRFMEERSSPAPSSNPRVEIDHDTGSRCDGGLRRRISCVQIYNSEQSVPNQYISIHILILMSKLIRISLENFMSLDRVELDLGKKDGPCRYALIYGENGSGKTDLVRSLGLLRDSVGTNALDGLGRSCRTIGSEGPMVLRYEFESRGYRLLYGMTFGGDGMLVSEELRRFTAGTRSVRLFLVESSSERTEAAFGRSVFSAGLSRVLRKRIGTTWGTSSLLSILMSEVAGDDWDRTDPPVSADVRAAMDFAAGIVTYVDATQGESLWPNGLGIESGVADRGSEPILKAYGSAASSYLVRLFSDVKDAEYRMRNEGGGLAYELVVHKMIAGEVREIPVGRESTGTRRLLGMLPALLACASGGVAMIDGFDSGLHDKLVLDVLGEIGRETGGQLIVTTHETLLLETAEPSDVFVIRTDIEGRKEIRSFDSIAPTKRGHHNNRLRYLDGLFDGIPLIRDLDLRYIASDLEDEIGKQGRAT